LGCPSGPGEWQRLKPQGARHAVQLLSGADEGVADEASARAARALTMER
jgi:hypothetical protein